MKVLSSNTRASVASEGRHRQNTAMSASHLQLSSMWSVAELFDPQMPELEPPKYCAGWNKAVARTLGWVKEVEDEDICDAADGVGETLEERREVKPAPGPSLT